MAVITVQGALKTNAVVRVVLPLAILAVPILDTSFVVAKRLKYRRPIYRATASTSTTGWRASGSASGARSPTSMPGHSCWREWRWRSASCLHRQPRQLRCVLDHLHGALPGRRARGEHLRHLPCWRSSSSAGSAGGSSSAPRPAAPPDEAEVDVAVQHELDTGTFQAVDPTTGEMAAIDPDTGEIEAVSDPIARIRRPSGPSPEGC